MNKIRNLRLKKGLSQSQLAVAANTHQSVVSKAENGNMAVSHVSGYQTLERIARVLGTDADDLLEDVNRAA